MNITLAINPEDEKSFRRLLFSLSVFRRHSQRVCMVYLILGVLLYFLFRTSEFINLLYFIVPWIIAGRLIVNYSLQRSMVDTLSASRFFTRYEIGDDGFTSRNESNTFFCFIPWSSMHAYDLNQFGLLVLGKNSAIISHCPFQDLSADDIERLMAEMRPKLDAFLAKKIDFNDDFTESAAQEGQLMYCADDEKKLDLLKRFFQRPRRAYSIFSFVSAAIVSVLLTCLMGFWSAGAAGGIVFLLYGFYYMWIPVAKLPQALKTEKDEVPLRSYARVEDGNFCCVTSRGERYRLPLEWLEEVLCLGAASTIKVKGKAFLACDSDTKVECLKNLPKSYVRYKPTGLQLLLCLILFVLGCLLSLVISFLSWLLMVPAL